MRRYYFLLLSFLLISFHVYSQQGVTVQLIVPPGNELKFDESINLIITKNTEGTSEIYLRGQLQEAEDGMVFKGQSDIFTIEQGVTKIDRRHLDPIKPAGDVSIRNDYEEYARRTGKFPPGEYEFCVRVISAETEEIIAEDCFEKTVEAFLPPSLISPENEKMVSKSQPLFTWSPVPGASTPDIDYTLQIVELQGNQSPIAAFESNPIWYKETGINSPIYQYSMAAREFTINQKYAWKVTAFTEDNKIGESEVWSFTYKKDTLASEKGEEKDKEDKEEEESLIPKQYVSLKDNYQAGYYLFNNFNLRFAYKNKYAKSKLQCHLENTDNEIIAKDILKKEQKPGLNFNKVDITNRVEPGETYLLECKEQTGDLKGFRFRVRKENNNEIIDELNVEEELLDFQGGLN